MQNRPKTLTVVIGTSTEIGKTYVSSSLAKELRDCGIKVSARKLAQSFSPFESSLKDSEVLAQGTGEKPDEVCLKHRNYEVALAPPLAASFLGKDPFTVHDLVEECTFPPSAMYGIIETAGGVRSPQAMDGDCCSLILEFRPDTILLVANAELGVISATLTSIDSLKICDINTDHLIVYINRYDRENLVHLVSKEYLEDVSKLNIAVSIKELAHKVLT